MCTKAKTRIRQLLSQAKTQELWKTLLLHPLYLQGHLEKKLFPSTSTSTISTDFDSASLPRDFEADPASGSASGWDVRNDIDVGKKKTSAEVQNSSDLVPWYFKSILQMIWNGWFQWSFSDFCLIANDQRWSYNQVADLGKNHYLFLLHNIHNFKTSKELISSQFPVSQNQNLRWAPSVGPAPFKGASWIYNPFPIKMHEVLPCFMMLGALLLSIKFPWSILSILSLGWIIYLKTPWNTGSLQPPRNSR